MLKALGKLKGNGRRELMNTALHRDERIKEITNDLQLGKTVTDRRFDQIFPEEIRNLSETHWTPINVAIRAARMFSTEEKTRILDIGSGCGKFCTVAALSCRGQFIGVEQRPHLVDIARKAADAMNVTNVTFIQSNMIDIDWNFFDGFYLFNPFYEHKIRAIRMDANLYYDEERFERYVEIVRSKLRIARPGTKVVTYHGFGGEMPANFECVKKELAGTHALELWVKSSSLLSGAKRR